MLNASRDVITTLGKYKTSFHAIVAHATLMHHVAKAKGELLTELAPSAIERHTALTYRSAMMGLILQSNDRQVASDYGRTVTQNPLLSMVEGWAFPTYTHDAKPTPDFLYLRHFFYATQLMKSYGRSTTIMTRTFTTCSKPGFLGLFSVIKHLGCAFTT